MCMYTWIAYASLRDQTNEGSASLRKLKGQPLEISINVQKLIVARHTLACVEIFEEQAIILYFYFGLCEHTPRPPADIWRHSTR